jgi:N-acylneuraminate cytidylyltransferase
MIDNPGGDCVRGVVEAGQNPYKMWKLGAQSDYMIPLLAYESINEPYNAPRQLLPRVYWQTGHIDVIRTKTILEKGSLTGENVLPLIIDSRFAVDIDSPSDWEASERLVYTENLSIIDPAEKRRQFPKGISLLAMDFDGVLTDDRVIVDQNGKESVIANRSDGLGLEKLRKKTNIRFVVISKEVNPVVAMRCQKLNIPFIQSIEHKAEALHQFITDNQIESNTVIFIGNDTNDLSVLKEVGFFVAPKNAHPEVLRKADLILSRSGGYGAIRELCDMILAQLRIS